MVGFASLVQSTQHRTIVCDDPCHKHNSPTQDMYALTYRGHHVALTVDGHQYSVRMDRNPLTDRHGMSRQQAFAYVEERTRN
jgi:hypothetical protein